MLRASWTLGKRLAFLYLCAQLGTVSLTNCWNFHVSSQASCFTVKRFGNPIQMKNSPFISPKLCCLDFLFVCFLLDHYPCQQVTQMQSCLCQSSPGRTAVASHGLGQVLTAECPGQHTHPVSLFFTYTCSAPVRADDLPTQVNWKLPCNPSWDSLECNQSCYSAVSPWLDLCLPQVAVPSSP